MDIKEELIELDAVVEQVSRGVNAVAAMSRGLDRVDDPYADGFYLVSDYLVEAVQTLRERTDRCLQAM